VTESQLRPQFRLGVDIGGTFTDLALLDEGSGTLVVHKVLSQPEAPAVGVLQGVAELLEKAGRRPEEIGLFVHGTTIGLNAVLQRKVADTALLVSPGMRDLLEIGRLDKPQRLDLHAAPIQPLVPRRRVIEVPGRLLRDGTELEPVDPAAVEAALAGLDPAVVSVAVCLLNGYASPRHERAIGEIVSRLRPDLAVTLSTDLWPEIREFERASVAVLNAAVRPVVARYLDDLERRAQAAGLPARLYITRSNGGLMPAGAAREVPVHTLLSGPAAGVVGAAALVGAAGVGAALTLDIGGTSADVSIVSGGEAAHSSEAAVGEFPLIMPAVDVFSVGAGGGSIAWFDDLGLLKLGPHSAGAVPGPACYGRGGSEPTVTDAYLLCGFVNPDNFIGGSVKLDSGLAHAALTPIAERLGCGPAEAAEAVLRLATSNMATALLPRLTKRGIDARDLALVAFGGAGPVHACLLAEEIGMRRIVVPATPGTLCAVGAVLSDLRSDHIRTLRRPLQTVSDATIAGIFTEMAEEGRAFLADEKDRIVDLQVKLGANLRYAGQAFDVEVWLPPGTQPGDATAAALGDLFHDAYERLYRNSDRQAALELINLRAQVIGRVTTTTAARADTADTEALATAETTRALRWNGRDLEARVLDRSRLREDRPLPGPAVIEQYDTATVVAPGWTARLDPSGLLILDRKAQ